MTSTRDGALSTPPSPAARADRLSDATRRYRLRRRVAIFTVIGAVIVALAVAQVAIHRYVGTERIQRMLAEALDGYEVVIDHSEFSVFKRAFVATGVRITPNSPVIEQRHRLGKGVNTRYTLNVASIRFDGVGLGFLAGGPVRIRSATIDSLDLYAYLDRKFDTVSTPTRLPHVWLQSLGRDLLIDTLRLLRAEVRYAERSWEGARPGIVTFDTLTGVAYNVTNRSTRPAEIELQGRVAGGKFHVQMTYELTSPELNLAYHGTVTRLEGRRLNSLLPNLQGMRIREGRLDSAWFAVKVKDGLATGKLQLLYDDLDTELLNKVTHKRSLKDKIKTLIANSITLDEDNRYEHGRAPKTVALRRRIDSNTSLLDFIWKTLRDGILTTVMG